MECKYCDDKLTVREFDANFGMLTIMPCPKCNDKGQRKKKTDYAAILKRLEEV